MTGVDQLLRAAGSVLVVDWPSPDVPDTLVRAGYEASRQARTLVESAGLAYVDDVYIADAVRRLAVHE